MITIQTALDVLAVYDPSAIVKSGFGGPARGFTGQCGVDAVAFAPMSNVTVKSMIKALDVELESDTTYKRKHGTFFTARPDTAFFIAEEGKEELAIFNASTLVQMLSAGNQVRTVTAAVADVSMLNPNQSQIRLTLVKTITGERWRKVERAFYAQTPGHAAIPNLRTALLAAVQELLAPEEKT